jgi:hypothetical protein
MKSLTLTPQDLEQFTASSRHSLRLFYGQFKQLQPKFPTVTREALDAMVAEIDADPHGVGKTPGIDQAIYFAAFFLIGAQHLDGDIKALEQHPNAGTLLSLFQRTNACASFINALTLLGQGGLMPQLHFDEAQQMALKANATKGANALHAMNTEAKAWVLSEWEARKAEVKNNKTAFARKYVQLVKEKFPKARASFETIKDDWLPRG